MTVHLISNFFRLLLVDDVKEKMLQNYHARYEMVSETTNEEVYDYDFKANQIYWNDRVFKLFGLDKKEIKAYLTWWGRHFHDKDRNQILREMARIKAHHTENWSAEYRFKCKDGTYKHVVDRAVLRYDLDQNPLNMIGSTQGVNNLS